MMLTAEKKWARQTVRTAMQVQQQISHNKAVLHAQVYLGEAEVRRTGSFALNSVTMQLYYSRSLCPTAHRKACHRTAEVAQQSLVPEYWFEQTIQRRGLNVLQVRLLWKAGVMLWCVSWTLWETEQTDTESLEEPYEVFSFPPCCAEGPRLTPRWHLIALITSYNIHNILHHLTSVLEGSSGFFSHYIKKYFVINEDNYLFSRCQCVKQITIILITASSKFDWFVLSLPCSMSFFVVPGSATFVYFWHSQSLLFSFLELNLS